MQNFTIGDPRQFLVAMNSDAIDTSILLVAPVRVYVNFHLTETMSVGQMKRLYRSTTRVILECANMMEHVID